jgi:HEAT repeat protein
LLVFGQDESNPQFDPDPAVRLAAVERIIEAGGSRVAEQLRPSCRDGAGDVQRLAVAGIVNFYIPGYVRTGVRARLARIGDKIVRNKNEFAVDPWVQVREEDGEAIRGVLLDPKSPEAKLEAANALAALRYKPALPDLIPLLKTKQDDLMYAAVRAIELSGDKAAAQETVFLIRDLNEQIHLRVMSVNGVVRNEGALPDLAEVFHRNRNARSQAGAMEAIAMIASPESAGLFEQNLNHRDPAVRGYAAEGLGRIRSQPHKTKIEEMFQGERAMRARLAQAFALVYLGKDEAGELKPFDYLFNTLNSRAWRGVAKGYWEELAREAAIRDRLRNKIPEATNAEKAELAMILARSGDRSDMPSLEALARDRDPQVAQEAIRATKVLQTRLP